MDHPERVRTTILEARALPQSERRSKIAQLSHGFMSDRWLAVVVAAHGGEWDFVIKGLRDPSLSVRASAAALSARHLTHLDSALFVDLDDQTLAVFTRNLLRRGGKDLETIADALINAGRLFFAAHLLPACSEDFVQQRLDLAWPNLIWAHLARYSPDPLVANITREFKSTKRPDEVWGRYDGQVWKYLSRFRPAAVLEWVEKHAEVTRLPEVIIDAVDELILHDINRVILWLSKGSNLGYDLPARLVNRARYVKTDDLLPLGRVLLERRPELFANLISKMDYPSRDRLFEAASAELETKNIEWPIEIVEGLGAHLRDREAARMLELPRAKREGSWRRRLMGLRLLENAREALAPEIRSAQAQERGEAWAALVNATRLNRDGWELTLERLLKTKNEQDPVRAAYLAELGRVPGYQFKSPELLERVLDPIFEARDVSWESRRAVTRIAQNLMVSSASTPDLPQFRLGLTLLEKLAGHSGTPNLPLLYLGLPKGAEGAIFTAIKPWLEAAKSRQMYSHIYEFYSSLGKRAWNVKELEDMVENIMWKGQKIEAYTAAEYWLRNPATRGERALKMLKKDGSAIHLDPVFVYCARRHQSLMMPRFSKPVRGRFNTGKVDYVPQIDRGFWRWTEEQQKAFARLVRRASREEDQFGHSRAWMIRQLGYIPVMGIRDFEADLKSKDVLVQEAALGALVWLDDPRGVLDVLMSHLHTDRARVAMYGLQRLSRVIPGDELVDGLEELLQRDRLKVTVHKEALRLLGQVGSQRALRLLHTQFGKSLHRDTRIATLHSARSTLDNPLSWQILEAATQDPDKDVVRAVFEVPVANVPLIQQRRYLKLMLGIRPADPETWQNLAKTITQGWYLVDLDAALRFGFRVLADPDPNVPWRSILSLLKQAMRELESHDTLETLILQLTDRADSEFKVQKDHDQDAFWRLKKIFDAFIDNRQKTCRAFNKRLGAEISKRENWWADGARLFLLGCEIEELFSEFSTWVGRSSNPLTIIRLEDVARELASHREIGWDSQAASDLCERFVRADDAQMRRVSLGFLRVFGARWHWGPAWVDLLNALRADEDLETRLAARSVIAT